jgi:hypothetical protein
MAVFLDSSLCRSIATALVICLVAVHIPTPLFAGQKSASEDLKQIQYKYYFRGKYTEAIDVLKTFLARTDVPKEVEVSAREFLAASYVLSGSEDKGKDQFLRLLNENEQYAGPDPAVFRTEVVDAYVSTRDTLAAVKLRTAPDTENDGYDPVAAASSRSKPVYKKWWFYAGLVAVLVVVAAAASPKEEETPEPAAPAGTVSVGVRIQ